MWTNRLLDPLCDPDFYPCTWIFKVQFSNNHISGMVRWVDLERKECESDTMLDPLCNLARLAIWVCPWATAHNKYIGQVMGWCRTVTLFNLLAYRWAVHFPIYGLRGVFVLWMPCLLWCSIHNDTELYFKFLVCVFALCERLVLLVIIVYPIRGTHLVTEMWRLTSWIWSLTSWILLPDPN